MTTTTLIRTVPAAGPRFSPATLAVVALLVVTASWGSTFTMLHDVITRVPVPDLLAVRFTIAAVVLFALRPTAVLRLDRRTRLRGMLLGGLFAAAQILGTTGLAHTSASVSGFITGMYVVLTPVLGALLLRQRVGRTVWAAVMLATVGLGLLSLQGFAVGPGELLTLASAALYAAHILGLGMWSTSRDALGLAVVQMATVAAVCSLAAAPGGLTLPDRGSDWALVVFMAVLAGAVALLVQTWAQAHLPATRAAVVMTMEPVWAAGFAVTLGGEALGLRAVFGGLLVLAAMYLTELGPRSDAPGDDLGSAEDIGTVLHVGPV